MCKASDGMSNATKIVQIDERMNKICLLQMKGVMGMLGWHMWPVCILDLEVFGCHSIIFSLEKACVNFRWRIQCNKNHSNWWRDEQDMSSPSEGGHGHAGWHIWPICILEFKIFGHHFVVFALQKGFVKL